MPQNKKLKWALELASRGFLILPLPAGSKIPIVTWKNSRTTDPARITAWFKQDPDMNYGVCPGSGGAIIDLDQGKEKPTESGGVRITDGVNDFTALERDQDITDIVQGRTFTVKSPSSGFHLYLLTKEGVSNQSGFSNDIDVRGEGGYVVGPGCYYNGLEKPNDIAGTYDVVLDLPFMDAPQWCLDRMRADVLRSLPEPDLIELDLPSNISQGKEFLSRFSPAIEGARGEDHTYAMACALCHNFALSQATALDLAANYKFRKPGEPLDAEPLSWNDRCLPPWTVYGAGDTLEAKIRNGDRYGQGRRGQLSGALMLKGLDPELLAQAEAAAIEIAEQRDEKWTKLSDHLLRGEEIFRRIKPMKWIIPFWLPGAGIAGIVGESGIGKSTLLLDLALRLAHDMEWHETPIRKGLTVIYTCGEDYEGAVLQMRAWCKAHGLAHPDPKRFVFMPEVPPLANIEEVHLWIEVLRDKVGTKDNVLCLDTWQRATAGLSQNEEKEMQGAVNLAEGFGRALGGPVVVAFHSPKSNRGTISGWEGQRNTSNALWFMENDGRGVKLDARKVRGGKPGNYITFDFEEHDTGIKDEYFGFELKHVVPKRVAGMRITADGNVYKEENMDSVRHAVAEVLYSIETHRPDDTSATAQYTIRHAAERIVGHPERPTLGRPPLTEGTDSWARDMIKILEDGGLRFPMPHAQMMKFIQDSLNPSGYSFEDGRRLYLKNTNGKERICIGEVSGP